MPKPIAAHGFKGMNNLPRALARLLDDERQLTPQIVLNADVTDGGAVRRRGGYRQTADLSGCHSLWAESVMLLAAQGSGSPQALFRLEGAQAAEICEIPGPRACLSYEEISGRVYLAGPRWRGAVYDLAAETARPWGVDLPPAPDINLVAGALPPGTYTLGYTNTAGGQMGGNGPLVQISWVGGNRGLELKNRPPGALCWLTQPHGQELLLAPLSGEVVTGLTPLMQPLPTFGVQPPPGFAHFIFAFGRIWGAKGTKVIYSDPHQYEWFRAAHYFPFLEEPVLLAPVSSGIFVNSRQTTWFLEGTDPAKMRLQRVGDGAIPGTLCLAQVEGGGFEISRKLAQLPSPVWMSPKGVVVGTHTGHLVHLTEARVRLRGRGMGAALYRVQQGIPQVLVSLYGPGGEDNPELLHLFEEGRIFH